MPIRLLWLCFLALPLQASTLSLAGSLNSADPNDVFFYEFTVSAPTNLLFQSYGYGGGTNAAGTVIPSGGFDPYLSVFSGTGAGATFLASNDDGACPPGNPVPACADPTLSLLNAAAGSYTLALSVFDNFSFAENYGSGTLGDGFIGFGDYFDFASGSVRTPDFALDFSSSAGFVPEPRTAILFAAGAAALILFRRKVSC